MGTICWRALRRERVDLVGEDLTGCVIELAEQHKIIERADRVSQ